MSKSKCTDGRRNNRPPEQHRIQPGEIRNPNGCKGKARPRSTTRVDEFYLREGQRVVSRDESGEVSAAKRLVQEEFSAALVDKDPKARERLLKMLSELEQRLEDQEREATEWLFTCKAKYDELFRNAKKMRTSPPDVMHPDHLRFVNGVFVIAGPVDPESREEWEELKACIKIAAWLHGRAREAVRLRPTEANRAELKAIESHRRLLMRRVPKGWNWREDIYCCHSRTAFVNSTIAVLEGHA